MTTITFPSSPSVTHVLPFATELTLPVDVGAFDLIDVSKLHNDLLEVLRTEKSELLKQLLCKEYTFLVLGVGDRIRIRWTYLSEGERYYILDVSFHHLYAKFDMPMVEAAIKQRLRSEPRQVGSIFDMAADTATIVRFSMCRPMKVCKRIRGNFYREADLEEGSCVYDNPVENVDPESDQLD